MNNFLLFTNNYMHSKDLPLPPHPPPTPQKVFFFFKVAASGDADLSQSPLETKAHQATATCAQIRDIRPSHNINVCVHYEYVSRKTVTKHING